MKNKIRKPTLAIEQAERIKYLRNITHLTRRSFSAKHNLPTGSLQNCEDGRYKYGLTQKMAEKLVIAFQTEGIDCQLNWLLYGEGILPKHHFAKSHLSLKEDGKMKQNVFSESALLQLAIENEKLYKINAELFESASMGRSNQIISSINSGADTHLYEGLKIKPYDSEHNTLLHLAIMNGHYDIVKFLIKKGANINARNRKDETPLHIAVHKGHKNIMHFLIENNADIDMIEQEGDTPLAWAAYKGQTAIVKELIELGADIHVKNKMGNTPLHWAAEEGYTDIIDILIKAGANINIKNNDGNTPLLSATQNGHLETVKYFIKKQQEINMG